MPHRYQMYGDHPITPGDFPPLDSLVDMDMLDQEFDASETAAAAAAAATTTVGGSAGSVVAPSTSPPTYHEMDFTYLQHPHYTTTPNLTTPMDSTRLGKYPTNMEMEIDASHLSALGPGRTINQHHQQPVMDYSYSQQLNMDGIPPTVPSMPRMPSLPSLPSLSSLCASTVEDSNGTATGRGTADQSGPGIVGISSSSSPSSSSLPSPSTSTATTATTPTTATTAATTGADEKICPLITGETDICNPDRCGPGAPCMNFTDIPPIEECTDVPCMTAPNHEMRPVKVASPLPLSLSLSPQPQSVTVSKPTPTTIRTRRQLSSEKVIGGRIGGQEQRQQRQHQQQQQQREQREQQREQREQREQLREQRPRRSVAGTLSTGKAGTTGNGARAGATGGTATTTTTTTTGGAVGRPDAKSRAKQAHSLVEKKYRENLNAKLLQLHDTLRMAQYGPRRQNHHSSHLNHRGDLDEENDSDEYTYAGPWQVNANGDASSSGNSNSNSTANGNDLTVTNAGTAGAGNAASNTNSKFRKGEVLDDALEYVNQTEVEMRHMEDEIQRLGDMVGILQRRLKYSSHSSYSSTSSVAAAAGYNMANGYGNGMESISQAQAQGQGQAQAQGQLQRQQGPGPGPGQGMRPMMTMVGT